MSVSTKDHHDCPIGEKTYRFRTPRVHDSARLRRSLALQQVRCPDAVEFLVAGRVGIEQMAAAAGEQQEGARQVELFEEFHRLLKPTVEDELEEVDPVRRAEELERREQERKERLSAIYPEVHAIEANLERHHPPYAELRADRGYWEDVSRVEVVRLLLSYIGTSKMPRDENGFLTEEAYGLIPKKHRIPLATFAFGLMSPSETQRKN